MVQVLKKWLAEDPQILLVLRSGAEVVVSCKDARMEGDALADGFLGAYTPSYDGPTFGGEAGVQRRFTSAETLIRLDEVAAVRKYSPPPAPTKGDW